MIHKRLYNDEKKPFWKSKTVWVNGLTLLASGLTMFATSESLDPKIVGYITGLALPIVNVFLRFVTKEPIKVGVR